MLEIILTKLKSVEDELRELKLIVPIVSELAGERPSFLKLKTGKITL